MKSVSIIIPTWNHSHLIAGWIYSFEKVLRSRLKDGEELEHATEVIIVDNGSSDDTREILDYWLKHEDPEPLPYLKKAIFLEENIGFSGANNRGYRSSSGDYVLFLNNDIVFMADPIPFFLNKYKEGSLAGAALIGHDTGWNVLRGIPVPYIEGWCVFMSREVAEKLEIVAGTLWDSDTYPICFHEDIDLSLRARLEGIPLQHLVGGPFRHLGSQTTQRTPGFHPVTKAEGTMERFRAKWDHLTDKDLEKIANVN